MSFYACLDGKVFECSEWISSHVCTRAAARELSCVDGPRTLFRVAVDDVQGAVATLDKKASAQLHAKAGVASSKKQPKEKLSRAEKKVLTLRPFPNFSELQVAASSRCRGASTPSMRPHESLRVA